MAVQIRVRRGDIARVRQAIDAYGKQARFALARSLNDAAKETQKRTRAQIVKALHVRTPVSAGFLDRSVKITQFATRDRPSAVLTIADPGGEKNRGKAALLASLAGGGATKEQGRWGPLAVPTKALRPSPSTPIPLRLYPKNLRVLDRRDVGGASLGPTTAKRTRGRVKRGARLGFYQGKSGKWQIRGKERTFAIDPRYMRGNVSGGVYQRVGRGKHDLVKLWSYTDRVRVPDRIPFREITADVLAREFPAYFGRNLTHALATAR